MNLKNRINEAFEEDGSIGPIPGVGPEAPQLDGDPDFELVHDVVGSIVNGAIEKAVQALRARKLDDKKIYDLVGQAVESALVHILD